MVIPGEPMQCQEQKESLAHGEPVVAAVKAIAPNMRRTCAMVAAATMEVF